MAYPEKLENLLSVAEAAERWDMPEITIRKACDSGRMGEYARKIGNTWVILPEGMFYWKGTCTNGKNPLKTVNIFDEIKNVVKYHKKAKISAEDALRWIADMLENLNPEK